MTSSVNVISRFNAYFLKRLPWCYGVFLVAFLACTALAMAQFLWLKNANIGPLTLAMLLGVLVGNVSAARFSPELSAGINFAKGPLLRAAIVLYGFRVTFQDVGSVGWSGVLTAGLMVGLTFTVAVQLGTRFFKLDRETAVLIGVGSSICGAAAIMAAQPVLKSQEHKVVVAVATVVVFGTLAMLAYPLLYPYLGLSEHAYGVWTGSTVHEVAQVVTAGQAVSDAAASVAVIEKMLRVMMLAPFLFMLASSVRRNVSAQSALRSGDPAESRLKAVSVPWFALFFIAVSGFNSLQWLPVAVVNTLVQVDNVLLAMAMVALGLRTQFSVMKQAGLKPLQLALALFVFLSVGGFVINAAVRGLFAWFAV